MDSLARLSIRQKLTRIILITSGAAILVACGVFMVYDRISSMTALEHQLSTLAEITGSNTSAALEFGDARSATETLASLSAQQHIVQAAVYTKEGNVLAKYNRESTDSNFVPPKPQVDSVRPVGLQGVVVFRQIRLKGEPIGTIYLESDFGELRSRLVSFLTITMIVILLSAITAYVLSSRLQQSVSEPILDLARAASSISFGNDYSVRVAKKSEDEIGFLMDRFNDMMGRIQDRETELQTARDELETRVDERTRELKNEIGERKQAEHRLEEQRSFLNAVIDNNPVAIVTVDSDDFIRTCNPAFERLFLYRRDEALGKRLVDLVVPPEYLAQRNAARARVMQGETTNVVGRRRRKDGTIVDVEAIATPLSVEGQLAKGLLVLFRDVTERQRAEEALLRAKEAAEAASRAKSEFLANMSHEIRTPMNGIMGMTELVLDTELDPEQRNYLNLAKTSADSLLSLINDILDYSKIEAGKLDIDAISFNLGNCLGETMKTLSLRAHQKGLELAFEIQPDVNDALVGDPGRLRQIIVNLVGNAIKFTEQGEVILSVAALSRTSDNIELHFSITDTGIGIPKDKQGVIFESFQQADGSMTRKYGGTGLGLTISSRLVQLMKGRIWVESEERKGSCFHFTAVFALPKAPVRTVVPRDPETLRDMRVLIVDDNATNRHILMKMLENWHANPLAVDSGAKAIVTLREATGIGRTYPLILVDAQMPEMDGFAVIEAIKRNPEWRAATIMMLSSAGQRGDAIRCRELGVAAYLTKPVQQAELLDAILTALGTRPAGNANPNLITRHSLKENRNRLRILLAEDNPVNQLVAVRTLEKYGHSVTVASNGKRALAALERDTYDAILMDIQMPELNGWEATRSIREKEKSTGGHIPIVAMTAHAMKGDEERCLESGMDSYLTKPINTQELLSVLDEIASRKTSRHGDLDRNKEEAHVKAIDVRAALERIDGDRDLFGQIAALFKNECPKQLEAIRSAIASGNEVDLVREAHSLKGASANLGATPVSEAAKELENIARRGDLRRASEQLKVLEMEVDRLMCELEPLALTESTPLEN